MGRRGGGRGESGVQRSSHDYTRFQRFATGSRRDQIGCSQDAQSVSIVLSRGGGAPPRHYSYVPVPQLRSLSIPWLLAGERGRGEGEEETGEAGEGKPGKRGCGRGAEGIAAFPLKTQTRPRMHARCNPMVCIRYARRYPPRGKRLLHRAINV